MKPNTQPVDRKFQRRQKAIALITVLSVLAIMTIMAVAMLTLSMNETKSANKYADGEKASSLADSAKGYAPASADWNYRYRYQ